MIDRKHLFHVSAHGDGSCTIYRYGPETAEQKPGTLLTVMDLLIFDLRCPAYSGKIYDFVQRNRRPTDPSVWDILIDVLPGHKDALERVMMECCIGRILDAAGRDGEDY